MHNFFATGLSGIPPILTEQFDAEQVRIDAHHPTPSPLEIAGRTHWDEFHRRVFSKEQYENWKSRIPSFDCGCKEGFAAIERERPPQFDAGRLSWDWKRDVHNDVNQKVNRERAAGRALITRDDYRACWHGLGPLTSDRLVITIATGSEYKKLLNLTRPRMESYAKQCGADFVALTNVISEQWQLEKFRVHDFADQYEQTLFVDVDCVIQESCPNLFDMGAIAMHDDMPELLSASGIAWAQDEYDAVMASQGLPPQPINAVWNSGVVLCNFETRGIWQRPEHRLPDTHCSEQFWVQYQSERHEVTSLDSRFNCQWWHKDFESKRDSAFIVHFANAPNRYELIRSFLTAK